VLVPKVFQIISVSRKTFVVHIQTNFYLTCKLGLATYKCQNCCKLLDKLDAINSKYEECNVAAWDCMGLYHS